MDEKLERLVEALENVAIALEELRVLKEYELAVRIEHSREGHGPYVKDAKVHEDAQ